MSRTGPRTDALIAAVVGGRLMVGGLAVVAPRQLGTSIGVRLDDASPLPYVARLFGVRAVFMALLLAGSSGEERRRQLRAGVAVDVVDALAALAAGVSRDLPPRVAALVFAAAVTEGSLGLAALRSSTCPDVGDRYDVSAERSSSGTGRLPVPSVPTTT